MVRQGRAVQNQEVQVLRGTGGAATVLRVPAAPSNIAANFEATKTYLFFVTGRIGAFVGGATNPALPAVVQFGTVATGTFTERGSSVRLDSGCSELRDNGLSGAGRVGLPFQMLVRYTMPATAEDVEIRAHAGDASSAYLSDLAIWWWDTAVFSTQYSSTSGSTSLARYPTFTAADSVTATWSSGTEVWLVLYAVDIGFPDPNNAWHSKVMRGASFATDFIGGASAREIGSKGMGTVAAAWRQSMGFFRVHTLTSGTESFQVQVASSQSSTSNPQQVLYRSTIAAVKLADTSFQYTASKAGLFGVNSTAGQDRLTFTPTLNNDTQGGENYFTAVACTHSATGTSQRSKLALNNVEIAGHQGMFAYNGDSTCGVPMIALATERPLGGVSNTLDIRGLRNPYETPQGSAQIGYDVTELALPVNALPSAPVPSTPGPEVVLIPGREAPALTALTALPIEPSFALNESRNFLTRRFEMDTGHVVAAPMFGSPRASWELEWANLGSSDHSTLIAFLEARAATAWKWTPQHESSAQAFVTLGGTIRDEQVAPSVWTVRIRALQLLWVGP